MLNVWSWMNLRRMLVLGALVALLFVGPSWAADQAAPATGDKPATAAKKERADPRGPLPAYYRNVIDGAQREKAYKIFDEYEPKIDELKAQLKALVAKRDAEVEALLTAEQKSRIKELAAEAKAKRDAAGKKDAKPAATSTTEAAK